MDAGVLQTRGITSSLHHLSSTQTRAIQFKEFRVHVMFNGFPTTTAIFDLMITTSTLIHHNYFCKWPNQGLTSLFVQKTYWLYFWHSYIPQLCNLNNLHAKNYQMLIIDLLKWVTNLGEGRCWRHPLNYACNRDDQNRVEVTQLFMFLQC